MASSVLRTCSALFKSGNIQRVNGAISTSVVNYAKIDKAGAIHEAPIVSKDVALLNADEVQSKRQLEGMIAIKGAEVIAPITGIPEEHIKTRRVRIYEPAKNAMQSGTDNQHFWQIDFDNRERWENPLMGWTSTGDPHSNLKVEFSSKEDAIAYCEKNGWEWFVQPKGKKAERVKNYGVNFSWNRRTRVSTK